MSELIEVAKFEPGMVLAAPILNRYGQVLLAAGVELKSNHQRLFATWGIKLITVKGDDNDDDLVITEDMREQAEKIFNSRITWNPRSRLEKDLFEMGVLNLVGKLSKRENK